MMRRRSRRRHTTLSVLGVLLVVLVGGLAACASSSSGARQTPSSSPGTAGIGTPTAIPASGPFNLSFATHYALSSCVTVEPAGTLCVTTTGTGHGANGATSLPSAQLQQSSVYLPDDGTTCATATTSGSVQFTQADGFTFTGKGTFCRAVQAATFTYTITGGTGAYAGASGAGMIYVPPPSSQTDDTEVWSGSLLT
jgi:hypothetical protein